MRERTHGITGKFCSWSLVRATRVNRSRDDDEEVGKEAERSYEKNDQRNTRVDLPKVTREGTTEQKQSTLQHQRKGFHHRAEVPGDDPVQLLLSVLLAFGGGSSDVDRFVSVQPLPAEHREERREEGGGETRKERCLNFYARARGAGPLWDSRNVSTKGGVVHFVDDDTEEGGRLFVGVWLEVRLDLDDECRSHGRKQTSLWFESARVSASNVQD